MIRIFRHSRSGNAAWLTPRPWTYPITDVLFVVLTYYSLLSMGPRLEGLSWDPCTASPATTCGKNANPLNAREKLLPPRSCSSARRSREDQPDHSSGQQPPLRYPFSVQLSVVVHASTLSSHQPPMTVTRHQAIFTGRQPSATHKGNTSHHISESKSHVLVNFCCLW